MVLVIATIDACDSDPVTVGIYRMAGTERQCVWGDESPSLTPRVPVYHMDTRPMTQLKGIDEGGWELDVVVEQTKWPCLLQGPIRAREQGSSGLPQPVLYQWEVHRSPLAHPGYATITDFT